MSMQADASAGDGPQAGLGVDVAGAAAGVVGQLAVHGVAGETFGICTQPISYEDEPAEVYVCMAAELSPLHDHMLRHERTIQQMQAKHARCMRTLKQSTCGASGMQNLQISHDGTEWTSDRTSFL